MQRHAAICSLLGGGLDVLAAVWRWDAGRTAEARKALRGLVATPQLFETGPLPALHAIDESSRASSFPHTVVLFGAALASGWPWASALRHIAPIRTGVFCNGGQGFITTLGLQLPPGQLTHGVWSVGTVSSPEDGDQPVRVWFGEAGAVLVTCASSLVVRGASAQAGSGRASRFFPDFIRMGRDEHGHLIIPSYLVTTIVTRRHVWARRIPNMDGVTRACVFGKLVYPRLTLRTKASWKPNHPPWDNPEGKRMIGRKVAEWFFAGCLEWVRPGLPLPVIIEPQSLVPKKGKEKYRNITDARVGNRSLEDWGVLYFSARDLAEALTPRAICFEHDIIEGYHINHFSGCTGELVEGLGVIGARLIYPWDPNYDAT